MKIPRYWARRAYRENPGENDVFAWGWSSESEEDAAQMAQERAERLAQILADGNIWEKKQGHAYDYEAYPLREEIVQTIGGKSDEPVAMITRNRHGALVLNTAGVCFVDIDFRPPVLSLSFWDKLRWTFSASARAAMTEAAAQQPLEAVREWVAAHPGRSLRMYRTAAGLRLLFTDRLYNPMSPEVGQLFDELGSDRLYRALTRKQECFRARLTPKASRCGGLQAPPEYFEQSEVPGMAAEYARWVAGYDKASEKFGVCELVETFGRTGANEEISRVIAIHDKYTVRGPGLPLA